MKINNMKAKYQQPQGKVVNLKMEHLVLSGSIPVMNSGGSGVPTSGDQMEGRTPRPRR